MPFEPGVHGPLRDATPEAAAAWFARVMASRATRRAHLATLFPVVLDELADGAPTTVGAALLPMLANAGTDALTGADAMTWTSVVGDVALWLGDRAITRAPQLRWTLYTAHKKATGYQRAVLVGFARVDDQRYYVDVAHLVAAWADLAVRGRRARADFLQTIETSILADA